MKCKDGKCKGKCKGKKCPKKCDDCVEKHITKELTEKRKKAILRAKINSKLPMPINKLLKPVSGNSSIDNFAWANQLPPQQIIPKLKREDLAFTLKDIESKIEEAFKKYETGSKPKDKLPKRVSKSVNTDTDDLHNDFRDELPDEYEAQIPEQDYIPEYERDRDEFLKLPNAFNYDSVGSHTLVPRDDEADYASIEPSVSTYNDEESDGEELPEESDGDELSSDGEEVEFVYSDEEEGPVEPQYEPDESSYKYSDEELTQQGKGVHPLLRSAMAPPKQNLSYFGTKPKEYKPTLEKRKRRTKEEMRQAREPPSDQSRLFSFFPISENVDPPIVPTLNKLPSIFDKPI